MTNTDKKVYTIIFAGRQYLCRAGEQAEISVRNYVAQAGASYAFYLDGEPLPRTANASLVFTMPEHDVEITLSQRACGLPPQAYAMEKFYAQAAALKDSPVPPANAPANKAAFCSHCGSALPNGAKFCVECGKPVRK